MKRERNSRHYLHSACHFLLCWVVFPALKEAAREIKVVSGLEDGGGTFCQRGEGAKKKKKGNDNRLQNAWAGRENTFMLLLWTGREGGCMQNNYSYHQDNI